MVIPKHAHAGVDASRFAVKVFSVDKMEDLHIREEDVEASTLGMLRHKIVIGQGVSIRGKRHTVDLFVAG